MSDKLETDIVDRFGYILDIMTKRYRDPGDEPEEHRATFAAAAELTTAAELSRIADALDVLTDGQKLAALRAPSPQLWSWKGRAR